jgi:pantetheine-phosphate adenylyltransferase
VSEASRKPDQSEHEGPVIEASRKPDQSEHEGPVSDASRKPDHPEYMGRAAERIGVYPGTFDPVTLGHMDIIARGARLVDRLIVGVATNPSKSPLFTLEERVDHVRRETAHLANVTVTSFDALLMHFAEAEGATIILRGLRAVADFEYEFQMAGMNQQLNDRIETVFLMADVALQPIASKLVKEIAGYGGAIDRFVSPAIAADVRARLAVVSPRS